MAYKKKRAVRKVKTFRIDPTGIIVILVPIEEGHPTPFAAPVRHNRRAFLGPEQEMSKIKEADLKKLKDKYSILDSIRMTISGSNNRVLFS